MPVEVFGGAEIGAVYTGGVETTPPTGMSGLCFDTRSFAYKTKPTLTEFATNPPYNPPGFVQANYIFQSSNAGVTLSFFKTPTNKNWIILHLQQGSGGAVASLPAGFQLLGGLAVAVAQTVYVYAKQYNSATDTNSFPITFSPAATYGATIIEMVGGPNTQCLMGQLSNATTNAVSVTPNVSMRIPSTGGSLLNIYALINSAAAFPANFTVTDKFPANNLCVFTPNATSTDGTFAFVSKVETFSKLANYNSNGLFITQNTYTSSAIIWVGPIVGVANFVEPMPLPPIKRPQTDTFYNGPPLNPPSVIQSSSAITSSATSQTVVMPNLPQVGNLLVGIIYSQGANPITGPTGMTLQSYSNTTFSSRLFVYARFVQPGNTLQSFTATFATNVTWSLQVLEIDVYLNPLYQLIVGPITTVASGTYSQSPTASVYVPSTGGTVLEFYGFAGFAQKSLTDNAPVETLPVASTPAATSNSSWVVSSVTEPYNRPNTNYQSYASFTHSQTGSMAAVAMWIGTLSDVPMSLETSTLNRAFRPQTDTFSTINALTNTTYFSTLTDSFSTIDLLSTNNILYRLNTDTFLESDTLSNQNILNRTNTDSLTFFDALANQNIFNRTNTDTSTFSDLLSNQNTFNRTLTDRFTTSDTINTYALMNRILTDTFMFTDAANRQTIYNRSTNDTSTFADTLMDFTIHTRNLSEMLPFSDGFTRKVLTNRLTADAFVFSDNTQSNAVIPRSVTNTSITSDILNANLNLTRTLVDSYLLSDTINNRNIIYRLLTNSSSFSDSTQSNAIIPRTLSNTSVTSDTLNTNLKLIRSLVDSSSLSDSVTNRNVLSRLLTDAFSFSDSLNNQNIFSRNLVDTFGFADALTRFASYNRSTSDSFTTSNFVASNGLVSRFLTDTLSFSDSVIRSVVYRRSLNDTSMFADTLMDFAIHARNIIETLSVSDGYTTQVILNRVLADTTTTNDVLTKKSILNRNTNDTFSTTDSLVRQLIGFRRLSEVYFLTDSLASSRIVNRNLNETFNLTDFVLRQITLNYSSIENLVTSDSVGRITYSTRQVLDTLQTSDLVNRNLNITRLVSDSLVTSVLVQFNYLFNASLNEVLITSDSLQINRAYSRDLFENLPTIVSLNRSVFNTRDLTETFGLVDYVMNRFNQTLIYDLTETLTTSDYALVMPNTNFFSVLIASNVLFVYNGNLTRGRVIEIVPSTQMALVSVFSTYSLLDQRIQTQVWVPLNQLTLLPYGYR